MLKMRDLNCSYGDCQVLNNATLEVEEGNLIGLIGRNGVGKTTTLKSIMGLVPRKSGSVHFYEVNLSNIASYQIPRMGISYIPQGRHLFPKLTVMENLRIPVIKGELDKKVLEGIFEYFPVLKQRLNQKAGTLSGGEQQMLAVGRALIIKPKMVLMDEPMEGLMPLMVKLIAETVKAINEKGTTILLVEQNLKTIKDICQGVYIMEKGTVVYEGTPSALEGAMDIQERYLSVKV
ncbi:MAG TPA: ABC transporter ATP-binding protein [Acidobacteriota bacterium]|nr:ABC transporter ATP-binding protein [Acidobacteriota bacterium]